MKIYDLTFTDGKKCRYLSPEPEPTEDDERRGLEAMFCGRLSSMTRIIAPPPERLPWKRIEENKWELYGFTLSKRFDEEKQATRFLLKWPGNEFSAYDKDAISSAVRDNWHLGV